MNTLFEKMETLLALTDMVVIRDFSASVNWDKQLIAIRGARGVGKTTLMLQHIRQAYGMGTRKALYCALDSIYFGTHNIVDLARQFHLNGGEVLLLDEVHKYDQWSREVKEIYDTLPSLKVVISGSSLLNILNADADLSRRCRPYDMRGLSFREYLLFYHGIDLPRYPLEDLLADAAGICRKVNAACRPVAMFRQYLREGYYPFYDGDVEDYYIRLENVVNYTIEQEMTQLCGIDAAYVRRLKALISVIASSVPFEVDISKLAKTIGLTRGSVLNYLQQLQKAEILTLLYSDNLSVKKMQKPDKIYLQNPNLLSVFALRNAHIGTMRETFALCHLAPSHTVEYGKANGDFKVDGKYTFEVGGADKSFAQIADMPYSYLLVDDTENVSGHRLPLWLVGFLY